MHRCRGKRERPPSFRCWRAPSRTFVSRTGLHHRRRSPEQPGSRKRPPTVPRRATPRRPLEPWKDIWLRADAAQVSSLRTSSGMTISVERCSFGTHRAFIPPNPLKAATAESSVKGHLLFFCRTRTSSSASSTLASLQPRQAIGTIPGHYWNNWLSTSRRQYLERLLQARATTDLHMSIKQNSACARCGPGERRANSASALWQRPHPTPGWKGRESGTTFANPRPPAAPATLNLNLGEYYAACAVIGALSAQTEEPDREWLQDWSLDFGYDMAEKARERREKGKRQRDGQQ